jgi:hypothetical protein
MKLVWLLFIMPVNADDNVVKFPGSFATQEACVQFAELLITKREFKCTESEVAQGPVMAG